MSTEALNAKASLNNKDYDRGVKSMTSVTDLWKRSSGVAFKSVASGWKKLGAVREKVNSSIKTGMKVAAGAVVAGSIWMAKESIRAASDFEEASSKFDAVFKEHANASRKWANTFADSVGISKREALQFMASTQDLFVPLGFARDKAAEFSKQILALSTDLASFNNMRTSDVMRDIQAALTGSAETMKKYGVVINETKIKEYAVANGIVNTNSKVKDYSKQILNLEWKIKALNNTKTKSEYEWKKNRAAIMAAKQQIDAYKNTLEPLKVQLTDQQKAQAVLGMIMRGTTDAQGDAVRTAGSFANTYKRLKAKIEDAQVAIGQKLLPVVTPMVQKMADWTDKNKDWIATDIGRHIESLGNSISNWSKDGSFVVWWEQAKLAALGFKSALVGVLRVWDGARMTYHTLAAAKDYWAGDTTGWKSHSNQRREIGKSASTREERTIAEYYAQAEKVKTSQYIQSTRQKTPAFQAAPAAGATVINNININNNGVGNMGQNDLSKLTSAVERFYKNGHGK